ncbi:expressed unknown protein [Seminavis robusta]|uniref:CRM domain-containing protein n=1 Tax=Seminavis robusta TaxID=568900 RepID=A0A9N8DAN9_9STRA|nr:expressed unknown protein [Seminavis robusta]|eukprot:Sro17_g012170.1 n/a (202) ;mRNA; r:44869-45598
MRLIILQFALLSLVRVSSFQTPALPLQGFGTIPRPDSTRVFASSNALARRPSSCISRHAQEDDEEEDEEEEESIEEATPAIELSSLEKAWRHAKKPLMSIGGKGATLSHGNSLRQLLEAHTVVKVKVNTKQFGTLEKAFEDIRSLAEESGAPEGIELLRIRDREKVILFGMPGTMERVERGDFPPPPKIWRKRDEDADTDE